MGWVSVYSGGQGPEPCSKRPALVRCSSSWLIITSQNHILVASCWCQDSGQSCWGCPPHHAPCSGRCHQVTGDTPVVTAQVAGEGGRRRQSNCCQDGELPLTCPAGGTVPRVRSQTECTWGRATAISPHPMPLDVAPHRHLPASTPCHPGYRPLGLGRAGVQLSEVFLSLLDMAPLG